MKEIALSDTDKSLVMAHLDKNDAEDKSHTEKRNDEVMSYISQAKLEADTHARHIALILYELTIDGIGATRPEVRGILNEELAQSGRKPIAKGSESDAWRTLVKHKHVTRGETPSRWVLTEDGCKYLGVPYENN